ncbi:MAG: CFI-box-CTERM domain-containing protein, partial [Anaerolineae bacterium]
PTGDDGGAQLQCFIATAAYGSPLAPQVQLLREFRDRYLLSHAPGRTLVALYYTLSPPLAELIARSEVLRAIARAGLAPIVAWAGLTLWSPSLGLGVLLGVLGFGAWLAFRLARRRQWVGARCPVPSRVKAARSRRVALRRRLAAMWGCVLFALAAAALPEASHGGQPQAKPRTEVVGEVRLPQPARFALIRDQETGRLGLYRDSDAIFQGEDPLPLGKIVAVHIETLVLALPSGRTIEIPRGASLPGPRRLIFVRTALVDKLRFQVRSGTMAIPGTDYSVVDILGRRAILQRDAMPGERRAAAGPSSVLAAPRRLGGGRTSGGSPPAQEGATLAELVNRTPLTEVAPDTWEIPAGHVRELGNHMGSVLAEALASARPSVSAGYGIALRLDTSMGSGTLDRRGFEIQVVSLARRTGLEVGDRILFVSGEPINSLGGLISIYRGLKSDPARSEVKVVIQRSNKLRTLTYRIR